MNMGFKFRPEITTTYNVILKYNRFHIKKCTYFGSSGNPLHNEPNEAVLVKTFGTKEEAENYISKDSPAR